MSITRPYTIPVIDSNHCRAEFITQLANTCDYLEYLSEDFFNRIVLRLNLYRQRLNTYHQYIEHINTHIDEMKSSKVPLQVYSNSRYIVEKNRSTYKSIFEEERNNDRAFEGHRENEKQLKTNDYSFMVSKSNDENLIEKRKYLPIFGLGKPSANTKSIVSFLKWNTKENPYIRSTKIDPLNINHPIRKPIPTSQISNHFPRSSSVYSSKDIKQEFPNYFHPFVSKRVISDDPRYVPAKSLAPELILPNDLPELNSSTTIDCQQINLIEPIVTPSINSELTTIPIPSEDLPIIVVHPTTATSVSSSETEVIVDHQPLSASPVVVIKTEIPTPVIKKPLNENRLTDKTEPKSVHVQLVKIFKDRRPFITGKRSPLPKEKIPPVSTGNSFIGAIAIKAEAYRRERQDSESDSSDGSEWNP